jgi:hypothetical protein
LMLYGWHFTLMLLINRFWRWFTSEYKITVKVLHGYGVRWELGYRFDIVKSKLPL